MITTIVLSLIIVIFFSILCGAFKKLDQLDININLLRKKIEATDSRVDQLRKDIFYHNLKTEKEK